MSPPIESLESRTFLSASSLSADEATLTSAITALPTVAASDFETIEADLAGQTVTKAEKAYAVRWDKLIKSKYDALVKADTVADSTINKDVVKFDAATGSKVTAAGAKLEKDGAKELAVITRDVNTLHSDDQAGLATVAATFSSDSKLQTDIATIESNADTRYSTILSDATLVFSTDVNGIVS